MVKQRYIDIILDILSSSDVKIDKIEIYKFFKGTFYSRLHIKNINIGVKTIDCRPSDAIAIALRGQTPIYISDEVMDSAGIDNFTKESEVAESVTSEDLSVEISEEIVLENLNEALDKAISEEEYEVAARLRDRIKQLEKKSTSQ